MSNHGNFHSGPPAALMSYPFPIHNQQQQQQQQQQLQHPPLMEQAFINQQQQQQPPHFQPHNQPNRPRTFNSRPPMQTPKSEKRKQENLTCDACGIEVNSQQMMDAHIRGQKHIKKMKLKVATPATASPTVTTHIPTVDGNEVDQKPPLPPVVMPASEPAISTPSIESNTPAAVVKPAPVIDKSVLQTMNELAKFNKVTAKYDLIKETGPAHCKQFEVRLTLADETYIGVGTSIKRAQQIAAEQALATTVLKKPEMAQRTFTPVRGSRGGGGRGTYSNVRPSHVPRPKSSGQQFGPNQAESTLQNLINIRCGEISEHDQIVLGLHRFVEEIERALKIVSDKMMEECKMKNLRVVPKLPDNVKLNYEEQSNEDPSESFRMLKGAMKVSILAMRLFLKRDHDYALVLICANKPSVKLLNDIAQELASALNLPTLSSDPEEQTVSIQYDVQMNVIDACLIVKSSILPRHTIRIMLTSPVFRNENFLNLDEHTRQQVIELNPDPLDMLDKQKCLQAAAEIRHSNWFTRCMLDRRHESVVLRLLRDLQYNHTPLAALNLWCLTLLVNKCQLQPASSSASLFRSVFACLSSGVLLPNNIGPGLIDPCEKELVDAAAYMTNEQRLELTDYAQQTLRLIAFQQSQKVLHCESNESKMESDETSAQ